MAASPDIDPEKHTLLIHGMVDRPTMFTVADLKRFPSRSVIHFMECSGNGGRSYRDRTIEDSTPQEVDGLTSTSEWIGVPLATLMREVGADAGATWILAEGADAAVMTRSIPMSKVIDNALIAYGQNGEALRPEQGYPVRLFLPGWEGSSSVKWIRRIEVDDEAFMTREETSKYTDPAAGRHGASIQLHDGHEVDHHLPSLPRHVIRARVVGDLRTGVERPRQDRAGRDHDRRRPDVGGTPSCRIRCCRSATRGSARRSTGRERKPSS